MDKLIDTIFSMKDEMQAINLARFFKTKKGEYGYGDKFLGIKVPALRTLSKKYYESISLEDLDKLIKNEYHEIRAIAIFILVLKYEKGNLKLKKQIFDLYLKNVKYINNWDLVDVSARQIVGDYAYSHPKLIIKLANSNHLWSERIAIVASFYNIKKDDFDLTLSLTKKFINHQHDLIHKACGWMLREIGKKDLKVLYNFLNEYADKLPRTTLRYAIEKLDNKTRLSYLHCKNK